MQYTDLNSVIGEDKQQAGGVPAPSPEVTTPIPAAPASAQPKPASDTAPTALSPEAQELKRQWIQHTNDLNEVYKESQSNKLMAALGHAPNNEAQKKLKNENLPASFAESFTGMGNFSFAPIVKSLVSSGEKLAGGAAEMAGQVAGGGGLQAFTNIPLSIASGMSHGVANLENYAIDKLTGIENFREGYDLTSPVLPIAKATGAAARLGTEQYLENKTGVSSEYQAQNVVGAGIQGTVGMLPYLVGGSGSAIAKVGEAAVTGGVGGVASEATKEAGGSEQAQEAAGFAGMIGGGIGLSAFHKLTSQAKKEVLINPPLPDEVYRAVHNGVLEDATPEIKAEAAQVMTERTKRLEAQKGLVSDYNPFEEKGVPIETQNIHDVAKQIEPAINDYEDLKSKSESYRGFITDLQEKAKQDSPYTKQIEDLQAKIEEANPRKTKIYQAQIDELNAKNEEYLSKDTPDIANLREKIQENDYRMRDLAPQVSAAYREAAKRIPDYSNENIVENEPLKVEETPVQAQSKPAQVTKAEPTAQGEQPKTISASEITPEQPKAIPIADTVARQALATKRKGVTPEAANLGGTIVQSVFKRLADRFNGKLGTAEELYGKYGADVVSRKGAKPALMSGIKGAIDLATDKAKAVIRLYKKSDLSTVLHEHAHLFLDVYDQLSKLEDAPKEFKDDMAIIRKEIGVSADADLRDIAANKKPLEKFARGFERYCMDGIAPTKELAGVFAKIKQFMFDIYNSVKNKPEAISENLRGVMDRMFAEHPDRTVIAPEYFEPEPKAVPDAKTPYYSVPKEPVSLEGFLRKIGGIEEYKGELKHIGADEVKARGLKRLVKEGGNSIDDAIKLATEEGYFKNEPTHAEFLDALSEELRGRKIYTEKDLDSIVDRDHLEALNSEIDRLASEFGIEIKGKTRNQFWNEVAEKKSQAERDNIALAKEEEAKSELEKAEEYLANEGYNYEPEKINIRSLEDLENEHNKEQVTANEGQGETNVESAQSSTGGETGNQSGNGKSDNGIASDGRGEKTADRGRNGDVQKRPDSYIDKEGNIRPELLTDDTNILQAIQEAVDAEKAVNPNAFQHDVVSRAQTRWLAENLGEDAGKVIENIKRFVSNGTDISTYVEKLKLLITDQANRVLESSKKHSDLPSDDNLQGVLDEQARLRMILNAYSDVTNVSGRLLGTFRKSTLEEERAKIIDTLYQQAGNDPKKVAELSQKISDTVASLDNTTQINKYVRKLNDIKAGETIVEISNLAILSGYISHAGNMLGSFARLPLIPIEQTIKALLNKAYAKESGANFSDAGKGIARTFSNIPTMLSRLGTALVEGKTVLQVGEHQADINFGFDVIKKTYGFDVVKIANEVKDNFKEENYPELKDITDKDKKQAAIDKIQNEAFNTKLKERAAGLKTYADLARDLNGFIVNSLAGMKTSMMDMKSAKWFDATRNGGMIPDLRIAKIPLPIGSAYRGIVGGLFSVPHTLLRDVAYNLSLDAAGSKIAAMEGYTGDAIRKRGAELIANLDDRVLAEARKEGNYYSMLGDDNATAKAMIKIRDALDFDGKVPLGSLTMPVISIPMRAIHQGIVDYSPIGVMSPERFNQLRGVVKLNEEKNPELIKLREKIKTTENPVNRNLLEIQYENTVNSILEDMEKGAADKMQTMQAKLMVGTVFASTAVYLLQQGLMTPPASVDYKINKTREEDNAPPESILMGNTWIDIHKVPAIGTLMGLAAGMASVGGVADYKYKESKIKQFVGVLDSTLLAENPLASFSEFMENMMMKKGEATTENYASNFLASRIVPNLITQFVKHDSNELVKHDFWENLESRMPYASEKLQPRINPYTGEPVKHEKLGYTNIGAKPYKPNPNLDELIKLGFTGIANPRSTIHDVKLTPKEETQYNIIHGHLMDHGMTTLFQSDDYQEASPERRKQMFSRMRGIVGKASQSILFNKEPNLLQRINDHIEQLPDDVKKKPVSEGKYEDESDVSF